jgi:hypothetical protein
MTRGAAPDLDSKADPFEDILEIAVKDVLIVDLQ